MKKVSLFLLLLTPFFFLTCCQKEDVRTPAVLRINFQEGDLPSLHPHDLVIYLRGLSLAKNLYEPLTRVTESGSIELAGAEHVEVSDDLRRYTFTIRPHLWSDGTCVTAHHYERAWKAALTPNSSCSRSELLYCIKNGEAAKKNEIPMDQVGVRAMDERTLLVELAYPTPHFLELTAQALTVPLVDPTQLQQNLFNGPFMVDEWKKGSCMRLKRNPYYWNKERVSLDGIDIYFIEDVHTTFSLYEKGEIDWIGVPFCPLSTEMSLHLNTIGTLKTKPIGRSLWVFLNTQHPMLCSQDIRRALSLAIDRKEIADHILIGSAPSQKPLGDNLLPLKPACSLRQDNQEAQTLLSQGINHLALDPQKLPPIEISYSQQANRKQVAEYLQERWQKVLGLPVVLTAIEWNVLRSNLEKGLFTVSMAYEGPLYGDPLELLEHYATLNPSNFPQWLYPPFGELILRAKHEQDQTRRTQLLSNMEEVLIEQMPVIPICYDKLLYTHPDGLEGYVIDTIGAVDFTYSRFKPKLSRSDGE